MRCSTIRLVCGLAVAATTGAATAQAENQTLENRRQQQRITQPGGEAAMNEARQVLEQFEGMWMVQVQFDHEFMQKMHSKGTGNQGVDRDRTDREQEQQNRREMQEAQRQRGAMNAQRVGMAEGIARSRLILGDNVLEQRVFMTMPGAMQTDDQAREQARQPGREMGDDQVQGLAFFSFDPQQNRYTSVFMSDTDNMPIRYQTGEYDASSKRIVFNSDLLDPARSGMQDRDQWDRENRVRENPNQVVDPSQTSPERNQRELTIRDRSRDLGKQQQEVVVLEMIDGETFRVTMYDPQKFDQSSLQEGQQRDLGEQAMRQLPDGVLYRATYSKATGERAETAKQWFDRAISRAN